MVQQHIVSLVRALILRALRVLAPVSLAAVVLGGCAHDGLEGPGERRVATHVDDWRDEVIYQLLVDRFANGNPNNDFRVRPGALGRYQGGDWEGIVDHLDYLQELGVTAIWISPIVLNVDFDAGFDGYHGYWQVDLERLNPHFGDLPTLRRMVDACHDRGIKVIVDIVTNHMGQVFYYDMNLNGQPDEAVYGSGTKSPLERVTEYDPDWDPRGIQAFTSLGEAGPAPIGFFDMPDIFRVPPNPPILQRPEAYNRRGRVTSWEDDLQVVYGDFPGGLKDLRTENIEVREALTAAFVRWVRETDIDGFRIDTIKHVDYEFWEFFAPEVRRRLLDLGKENFLMFGEAFDGDDVLVGSYTMPQRLDSVFYFPQKFQVFDDVFGREAPASNIRRLFEARASNYGTVPQPMGIGVAPTEALVNFVDNHDLPRFLFDFPEQSKLHAALAYLMTQDGIPCLYYGTEQDFAGGNDPSNRERLWDTGFRTDGDTFRWIARLARVRRHFPALRRGSFDIRWATEGARGETGAGVVAFERRFEQGYALVVINAHGQGEGRTRRWHEARGEDALMEVTQAPGTVLVDVLNREAVTVGTGGTLEIVVPPHGARIFVPEADYVPFP